MNWTLFPASGRNWRDYYPGRDVVDVFAWDAYNYEGARKGRYDSPAVLFDQLVAVSRSEGKPWGLGETGSRLIAGDSGSQRAAWLRSVASYAAAQKALWVAYWDDVWTTGGQDSGDYRLRDAAGIAAWRAFCS